MCEDPAVDVNVALRALRGESATRQSISLFLSVGHVRLLTEQRMPGSR